MKKVNLLIAAVSVALSCGCTIDRVRVSPEPQPLPAAPAPVKMVTQADADFSVASEVNTKLRVVFNWTDAEKSFCTKLAERLAGKVVLDEAEIVRNSQGDVVITLQPEFELVDKTGEYYRINCNQIAVSIASKQKVHAVTTVEPKALPRKLGAQNAKNQYLTLAVEQIAPFLKKELEKLSKEQVAVSVVDFALKNVQEQPESQYVAAQINKITRILSSTSGVINFTNIRQDVSKAACSFRVVYLKEQFPQGISNVLNLKLAGK
ncbi:MAG: hypothetical protein IJW17_06900 [Lentisphaeria bacterium]|nr:hypothetical protein [Lentisphaeria bacterium]